MHEAPLAAKNRATEPARDGRADDEIVDLEERTPVAVGTAHAAAPTELEKWQALVWPFPAVRSSGGSETRRDAARSQRGANGQPWSSASRRGGTPGIESTSSCASRSGAGDQSMQVR